jgi:RND family efflux transporter MFP subunit
MTKPTVSNLTHALRLGIGWVGGLAMCLSLQPQLAAAEITIRPAILKVMEEVEVPTLEEGPIMEILVREGEVVELGHELIQIDDQLSQFGLQKAELELRIAETRAADDSEVMLAQAESSVAQASLQRALESRKKFPDTPSQAEVESLELQVAEARQHRERASRDQQLAGLSRDMSERMFAVAKYQVERHRVKAPIKGAVVEIFAKRGSWVRPGDPLVRIMRIDRLRVEGFLNREHARPGLIGAPVKVMIEGTTAGGESYPGKIVFISPEIDSNDNRQRVFAEVDNGHGKLGPGMRATMTISLP